MIELKMEKNDLQSKRPTVYLAGVQYEKTMVWAYTIVDESESVITDSGRTDSIFQLQEKLPKEISSRLDANKTVTVYANPACEKIADLLANIFPTLCFVRDGEWGDKQWSECLHKAQEQMPVL